MPTIPLPARAANRVFVSHRRMRSTAARSRGRAVRDGCGSSRPNAADEFPCRGPYLRGSRAIAAAGTAARMSQGTAGGRPGSRRVPVAELPTRTIRPETEDSAPV